LFWAENIFDTKTKTKTSDAKKRKEEDKSYFYQLHARKMG
jgi:hypothetical protein